MKKLLVPFLFSLSLISCTQQSKTATSSSTDSTRANPGNKVLKGPGYLSELSFVNDYPTNESVEKIYDAIVRLHGIIIIRDLVLFDDPV